MKLFFLVFAGCLIWSIPATAQLILTPLESDRLHITSAGGIHGATVVHDLRYKLYYTAFTGKASFPLEVFPDSGQMHSVYQGKTLGNLCGMWINPKNHELEANCYGDGGIIHYGRDHHGYPVSGELAAQNDGKPAPQSVGVMDEKGNILYLSGITVMRYKRGNGKAFDEIRLQINSAEQINSNTLLYFGEEAATYGVLDIANRRVLCFDANGKFTAAVTLPVPFDLQPTFNCAYANKRVWIFDQNRREWIGYQIFREQSGR